MVEELPPGPSASSAISGRDSVATSAAIADFDIAADVLDFDHRWIFRRGTIP
jgi:hypothetical protein